MCSLLSVASLERAASSHSAITSCSFHLPMHRATKIYLWLIFFAFAGIGIFVIVGSGEKGPHGQPNNGLVISNATSYTNGRRFRFFCRSNSSTVGVGEFIGPVKSPVTVDSFFGFPSPYNGGELRVESYVGTHSPLTASEQGVYTCRMPFEGGGVGEINIGVYPSGFSSELFNHGNHLMIS